MKKATFTLPKFTDFALGLILGMFLAAGLILVTARMTTTCVQGPDLKALSVVVTFKPDQPTAPTNDSDSSGIQAVQAKRTHLR